jgi:hypothetical protein
MFREQESPYISYCLLWAAALAWLCASGRGLASTGCLFYLTTVVCRFLSILLHAKWAVILQQMTVDTTMTCTFPVLSYILQQMAPLVSDLSHSPIKILPNFLCFWMRVTCPVYPTYKSRVHKAMCDVLLAEVRRVRLWILTVSFVHSSPCGIPVHQVMW